jgi:hypothetical protein
MSKSLKLGILSDSHVQTTLHQEAIEHLLSLGVDYLLHAGDIMLEEHLQMLEDAPVPYVCVFGNNDAKLISLQNKYRIYQEPYYFKIKEHKLKMMHIPYYLSADTDIVISGHTHMFECSKTAETLYINPGEVCGREKPLTECATIEIVDKNYKVKHYFRELSKDEWREREIDI